MACMDRTDEHMTEIHFFRLGGGGRTKSPKFSNKTFKFPKTIPRPHLHLKRLFLAFYSVKVSENSAIFRKGGGGVVALPRPTKISATVNIHVLTNIVLAII